MQLYYRQQYTVGGDDSIEKNKQRMTIPTRIVATNITVPASLLLTDAICLPKATKIFVVICAEQPANLRARVAWPEFPSPEIRLRAPRKLCPTNGPILNPQFPFISAAYRPAVNFQV